jgi:hypothetical protein
MVLIGATALVVVVGQWETRCLLWKNTKHMKRFKPRVLPQAILQHGLSRKWGNSGLQMMGSLAGSLFLCKEAVQAFDNGKENSNGTPGMEATLGCMGAVNTHSTEDLWEPTGNDAEEAYFESYSTQVCMGESSSNGEEYQTGIVQCEAYSEVYGIHATT